MDDLLSGWDLLGARASASVLAGADLCFRHVIWLEPNTGGTGGYVVNGVCSAAAATAAAAAAAAEQMAISYTC